MAIATIREDGSVDFKTPWPEVTAKAPYFTVDGVECYPARSAGASGRTVRTCRACGRVSVYANDAARTCGWCGEEL